jgi:adenylate kinase
MENLVPILMEGMLEVCKVLPEDPIDYLSEFVFKNSEDPREDAQVPQNI